MFFSALWSGICFCMLYLYLHSVLNKTLQMFHVKHRLVYGGTTPPTYVTPPPQAGFCLLSTSNSSLNKFLEKFSVFFYKVHVIIFITNNVKIKKFLEKFSTIFIRLVQSKNLGKYNDEKKAQIILGFYVNR